MSEEGRKRMERKTEAQMTRVRMTMRSKDSHNKAIQPPSEAGLD